MASLLENNEAPLSALHQPGFTSSLLTTLKSTRAHVDEYVESQMEQADVMAASYEARLQQEQQAIDEEASSLLAVQLERGLNVKESEKEDQTESSLAKRREELSRQQEAVKEEIENLQEKNTDREKDIKELKKEEKKQRVRAEEARELKRTVEETKKTTVNDLTRGIVNYKYLGLDFEKAKDGRLRFTFTHLDAGEPQRKFSFLLNVNDEDVYEVLDCEPSLPESLMVDLLDELNKSEDLSPFVRGMRNAFSSTL